MSRSRHIDLLLTLITFLVFIPVGFYSFVNYDDPDYVTGNSFVRHGLTGPDIGWAFTTFHTGNWHPLTWLSHMLDCQLFGLNPGAHHFTSVFWHVINVGLLFAWLLRLTGKAGPSAMVAALFAWHPLHVESVAWISERKDVLSTFFALLTLLAYTKYVQEKDRRSLWLALLYFALGLMAKPMLVTLPCVLLLLDFWPFKRLPPFSLSLLTEKIPFFILTLASCVVTFIAQQKNHAVASLSSVSMAYRLENAPMVVAGYLQKLIAPVDLCIFYPLRTHLSIWEVALSAAILIFISVLAWRWRETRPYFLMGWLWFLGTLVPVAGLVQVGIQSMADRYTYFPSIGFFIMVIFLAAELAEKFQVPRRLIQGLALATCLGCILATEYYLPSWRDSVAMFRRAIAVTQDNHVAYLDLGAALMDEGHYDEALADFQEALRLEPGWYQIHNNIGNILLKRGQPAAAAVEYQKALQLDPHVAFVHKNLGRVLVELGRYDEAMHEFSEAERLAPADPSPHFETAILFLAQGREDDALAELHRALTLEPDNAYILAYTACVLASDENARTRDGRTALALALKANALAPGNPTVPDALGMAYAETGDFTRAIAETQAAYDLAAAAGLRETNAIQLRLELYQKNQPWRESFLATHAPAQP